MSTITRDETGKLPGYAWPGCYEIHYMTRDGAILCHQCTNRENGSEAYTGVSPDGIPDPQWEIVACDIHWEGEPLQCDHCNRTIDSEYGVPDND
jgi:hypothetical protein